MYRIYIKRKNEVAGHVFVCRRSVKEDKIKYLPYIGFVTAGLIADEEWATSQELIVDKFGLYIVESYIDGRCKTARSTKRFSWKDVLEMKVGDVFKPVGYMTICNFFGVEIEISNCNSMVRYRTGDIGAISDWKEIHYTKDGRPYFNVSKKAHGRTRYYLDEFMKIS